MPAELARADGRSWSWARYDGIGSLSPRTWFRRRQPERTQDPILAEIDKADSQFAAQAFNGGHVGSGLQGAGTNVQRNRHHIYLKYQAMLADPIVSAAIRSHCTAALGGDESTGDVVFIEKSAIGEKDQNLGKLVDEIREDLGPLMNKIAYTVTFNACGYGDGYARPYSKPGVGIEDVYVEEMVLPHLVQAYEKGSTTVGFVVYVGKSMRARLTRAQMLRMKMPRTIYTAQPLAVEKAWHTMLEEDDVEKIPLMPAIAGGSFLDGAEEAYDRYIAALYALVGRRAIGSIDAAWLKVNMAGMTKQQQDILLESVANAQRYLKKLQQNAVATKQPILESVRMLLPVSDEKQVTALEGMSTDTGTAGYSIDDVMFHARLLAGALGIDLSMLGFADQMAGGLGDGGFFRMSAQGAERSRMIRVALDQFFNELVELHLLFKKKMTFEVNKRPWSINFFGTISALEAERTKTRETELNAGTNLANALTVLRDLGLDVAGLKYVLDKVMGFSEEDATLLAQKLHAAKPAQEDFTSNKPPPGGL